MFERKEERRDGRELHLFVRFAGREMLDYRGTRTEGVAVRATHGRQRRKWGGRKVEARGRSPRPVFMVVMVQYIRIGDDDW